MNAQCAVLEATNDPTVCVAPCDMAEAANCLRQIEAAFEAYIRWVKDNARISARLEFIAAAKKRLKLYREFYAAESPCHGAGICKPILLTSAQPSVGRNFRFFL